MAYNGSGTIDANGVFAGTITLSSGTKLGGYVWITDSLGVSQVSTTTLTQKPSAVPSSTSSKPGSTVSVTLTDWPSLSVFSTTASTTIGGTTVTSTAMTLPSTATATLTKFKFVVPTTVGIGTHKVVITEDGTAAASTGTAKTANFMLTIGLRSVTVTPSTAAPGQAITISGTGFDTSDGIITALTGLVMKAGTGSTTAAVNSGNISIDSLGSWNYKTTMPTLQVVACSACSSTIVFTATDSGGLVGVSDSAFARTARSVTLSPTTISPGGALTVTAGGFAVDTSTTGATMTVSVADATTGGNAITLVGTYIFPLGADGTGVGTVTLPTTTEAGTYYITVTDNAGTIHATTSLVIFRFANRQSCCAA